MAETGPEIRILLIGKTCAGKTATANTILKEDFFKYRHYAASSVSPKCEFVIRNRFGKKIMLLDTPGFLDTQSSKKDLNGDIKKCVAISSPGPHVFLLVISLAQRHTMKDFELFTMLTTVFGEHMNDYVIVAFTHKDHLEDESIDRIIENSPPPLRRIIQAAGGRYIAFNNRGNDLEKENDVQKLLQCMDEMISKNKNHNGEFFTSEIYSEAESIMDARMKEKIAEIELALKANKQMIAQGDKEMLMAKFRDTERRGIQIGCGNIHREIRDVPARFLNLFR